MAVAVREARAWRTGVNNENSRALHQTKLARADDFLDEAHLLYPFPDARGLCLSFCSNDQSAGRYEWNRQDLSPAAEWPHN